MKEVNKHPPLQRKAEFEFLTIKKRDEPTRIFKGNPAQERRLSNPRQREMYGVWPLCDRLSNRSLKDFEKHTRANLPTLVQARSL
jgi:hypothetical protein